MSMISRMGRMVKKDRSATSQEREQDMQQALDGDMSRDQAADMPNPFDEFMSAQPARSEQPEMLAVAGQDSVPAQAPAKVKATFHLTRQAHKQLTTLIIRRLEKYGKADKSSLICKAIELLHDNDDGK